MSAFPLAEVLSVTTGRLLCNVDRLYVILNHCTGDNLFTHVLPAAMDFARPKILRLFPLLGSVDLDGLSVELSEAGSDNARRLAVIEVWLSEQAATAGTSFEIPQFEGWGHPDPLSSLVDLLGGGR